MRGNGSEVRRKFARGVGALFLFIVLGIFAAETQLNTLTMASGFVRALNVKCDPAEQDVCAYVLGERIALGRWNAITLDRNGDSWVVRAGGETKIVLSVRWFSEWTKRSRSTELPDFYAYYKKAGDAMRGMRVVLEKYF